MFRILWLILVVLTTLSGTGFGLPAALAQSHHRPPTVKTPIFTHLTTNDGLPDDSVRATLQDRQGFLWIGTENGLVRYDGQEMRVFKPIPGDSTSISGRNVRVLHEDPEGFIWVGTAAGGLSRLDPRFETFTNFTPTPRTRAGPSWHSVAGIASAPDSTLWVALINGGLVRLDRTRDLILPVLRADEDLDTFARDSLSCLLAAEDGSLWFGVVGIGVGRFDPATSSWSTFRYGEGDRPQHLAGDVNAIHQDREGRIWLATRLGLSRWNRDRGDFSSFWPDSSGAANWENYLTSIDEDEAGRLWIGSAAGVYLFDPERSSFTLFAHDSHNEASLSGGPVLTVLCDRAGTVWVGCWQAGLNAFDQWRNTFSVLKRTPGQAGGLDQDAAVCVLEDRQGSLWVGTGGISGVNSRGGLNRRKPGATGFSPIPLPVEAGLRTILSLCEDPAGQVLVGTGRGVFQVDPRTEAVTKVEFTGEDSGQLDGGSAFALTYDDQGSLWIGTYDVGLFRTSPGSRQVVRYGFDSNDPRSLSQVRVSRVFVDAGGRVWVGTHTGGLNLFEPETNSFRRIHEPALGLSTISGICDADDGGVYAGGSGGLFHVSGEGAVRQVLLPDSRLDNAAIANLARDRTGDMWILSGRGLARMTMADGSVEVYDASDGVPGGDMFFGSGVGRDGALYFGSQEGLLVVRPEALRVNPYQPTIVLTEILVDDEPLLREPGALTVPYREHITLPHDRNDLKFHFAALHLPRPDQNLYRYQLEGDDTDWRSPTHHRSATYTNLDPGEYVFRVQGTNASGVWSSHGAALRVVIQPPWWRTGWAVFWFVLAAVAVIATIVYQLGQRVRIRSILEMERAEAIQLQRLDRMKSRFFANISHEFRTPLTLILGPLHRLQEHAADADQGTLAMMERNTRRLGQLIDQLLDLSRLEAGRFPIRWQRRDGPGWLRGFVSSFDTLAHDRNIKLTVQTPVEAMYLWFDSDLLEKIVSNLLSNAFKFTPTGGLVRFGLHVGAESPAVKTPRQVQDQGGAATVSGVLLQITVANSGSYIPPAARENIFDRFKQLGGEGPAGGSGIGLALIRELLDLVDGEVSVASDPGRGTEFTVLVPAYLENPIPAAARGAVDEATDAAYLVSDETYRSSVADAPDREPADAAGEPDLERPRLLVVEDNADLRSFLRQDLVRSYQVSEAEDGEIGVAMAVQDIPDLIISDVMMPNLDGFELCRRLKNDERTSHIPVILLTARTQAESRLEGLSLGADDYLSKPFDPRELCVRVANLIEQRRKLQEKYARRIAQLEPSAMPVTSADEKFLKRAREVVENHLDDADFSVELFGREMGLSRSHLLRKLKALTGQSSQEFIRSHRLQRAAQYLTAGYGNVTEVAYAVGFQSLSNFSKRFRGQYGVNPSEYIAQND